MNFITDDNVDLTSAVGALLGLDCSLIENVRIALSTPLGTKSLVMVEFYPSPTLQMLLFVFSRDKNLLDVVSFRGSRFYRVNIKSANRKHICSINQFVMAMFSVVDFSARRGIWEEDDEQHKLEKKDQQIQQLKGRNRLERERVRIEKDVSKGLRQQLKVIKATGNQEPSDS